MNARHVFTCGNITTEYGITEKETSGLRSHLPSSYAKVICKPVVGSRVRGLFPEMIHCRIVLVEAQLILLTTMGLEPPLQFG